MSRLVVKVGGAVAGESASRILGLAEEGHEVFVVHGAGPQITPEMTRLGIPVEFVQAGGARRARRSRSCASRWRTSTPRSAPRSATRAVPVFGDRDGLLAVPVPPLGQVGDPLPCRPPKLLDALAAGKVPVVAPLAVGPLNVNADDAAAALALGLGAKSLVFLTDVAGPLRRRRGRRRDRRARGEPHARRGRVRRRHRAEAARRGARRRERHHRDIGRTAVVA